MAAFQVGFGMTPYDEAILRAFGQIGNREFEARRQSSNMTTAMRQQNWKQFKDAFDRTQKILETRMSTMRKREADLNKLAIENALDEAREIRKQRRQFEYDRDILGIKNDASIKEMVFQEQSAMERARLAEGGTESRFRDRFDLDVKRFNLDVDESRDRSNRLWQGLNIRQGQLGQSVRGNDLQEERGIMSAVDDIRQRVRKVQRERAEDAGYEYKFSDAIGTQRTNLEKEIGKLESGAGDAANLRPLDRDRTLLRLYQQLEQTEQFALRIKRPKLSDNIEQIEGGGFVHPRDVGLTFPPEPPEAKRKAEAMKEFSRLWERVNTDVRKIMESERSLSDKVLPKPLDEAEVDRRAARETLKLLRLTGMDPGADTIFQLQEMAGMGEQQQQAPAPQAQTDPLTTPQSPEWPGEEDAVPFVMYRKGKNLYYKLPNGEVIVVKP